MQIEKKKYIVVENEAFDWEVQPEQLKNDPMLKESFLGNIFSHLTSCFSEFLGKKVSLKEINDALEKGYIEV